MTNQIVKIHDVETGEIIEREMNAEELEQFQKDQEAFSHERELEQNKENQKLASRIAILERLGITADEAALLLS